MRILSLSLFSLLCLSLHAQSDSTGTLPPDKFHRDYNLVLGANWDMNNSTINSRTAGKLLIDTYYRGLEPRIKSKKIRGITGFIWSFTTTWQLTMWPHEFGHYLRTSQVGGKFGIERVVFPMAFGWVQFPPGSSLEDETLFIIGGFEANFMMARDIQLDYYKYNGLYNDELYTAFFQRIMYPAYTNLFVRLKPDDPNTWLDEDGEDTCYGDPACIAKLLWERDGKQVIQTDGTVDPDLVRFYNQSSLLSLIWNLADINMYREASALFKGELNGRRPRYLIGDESMGWAYGTLFNASVLGAELYLNNYIRLNSNFYSAYLKYGFPLLNYGFGLSAFDIVSTKRLHADLGFEFWNQKFYGTGYSGHTNLGFHLSNSIAITSQLGWKTEGYALGKAIGSGLFGYFGLSYYPKKTL